MISILGPEPGNTQSRRIGWSRRLTYGYLAVGVVVIAAATASAQSSIPLTLAQAEDLAIDAEPGRLGLEARASALKAQASVAAELPDPTLRIGLNNYPFESGGFSTEGMTNVGVAYRQAFPAGKTRSIRESQFNSLALEMSETAHARGRNVLADVRDAWLDTHYWIEAHALVSSSTPFFRDLADVTRSLYSVGRKSQQDVLLAELELSRLQDRLIEIERQQRRARAMLGEWIGSDAQRPVAPVLPEWEQVPALATLRQAIQDHPALKAYDARIEAHDAGVDLAEQRSKPGWALDLGYSYREGMLSSGEPRSDFVSVNVTVDLPFFRRQAVDSTLTAALQERTAARSDRRRFARELESELEIQWAHWQELSRRLDLYETTVLAQARGHAEASLLAYQNDVGDFTAVMRAYIDELDTRLEHLRLRVDRARVYAALANLGGLPR